MEKQTLSDICAQEWRDPELDLLEKRQSALSQGPITGIVRGGCQSGRWMKTLANSACCANKPSFLLQLVKSPEQKAALISRFLATTYTALRSDEEGR